MFYDLKNNIIIEELPKNSIGPDGNFYIDFNQANDINLFADHGYYTINEDNNNPPSESYKEDESARIININKPYATVIRTWKQYKSLSENME